MNLSGYPSFFDEEYDCTDNDCSTCTFDCWKNYPEEREDDSSDEMYDEYYSCYEVICDE